MKMMSKSTVVGAAVAVLLAPLGAQGIGITIVDVTSSGASNSTLEDGDVLTVDLRVDNATMESIYGIGIAARGYDSDANGLADNGLQLLGASLTDSLFNDQAFAGPVVVGGLSNVHSAPLERYALASPFPFPTGTPPTERHAVLFEGADLGASTGDGSLDIGIGGSLTGDGDVHFQVQFLATAAGLTSHSIMTLEFGNQAEFGTLTIGADGAELPFTNASLALTIIPEPGTALLIGLGLAGLASRRR
ncbi:MAG: hypothetical protein CL908_14165 [Deltaproteobacteria bacterium]|nr:hypothetical protein [Deltaproteobacteria bacterium]